MSISVGLAAACAIAGLWLALLAIVLASHPLSRWTARLPRGAPRHGSFVAGASLASAVALLDRGELVLAGLCAVTGVHALAMARWIELGLERRDG